MIIKPRVRGFMCVTTHPVGCEANVGQQIDYVKAQGPIPNGPKRVLVIGASTGYGLASRISAAFDAIKEKTIAEIKADLGQVDLVVYSLASPRRQHPKTGEVFNSTLKPIGKDVTQRGVNTDKETIENFTLVAANQDEINNTVAVMGGEDWQMWIDAL